MKIKKIENVDDAIQESTGTSFCGFKIHRRLDELLKVLGNASIEGSLDSKVQLEWVFKIGKNKILNIYDWKEYDHSINDISEWHVGSKGMTEQQIYSVLTSLLKISSGLSFSGVEKDNFYVPKHG